MRNFLILLAATASIAGAPAQILVSAPSFGGAAQSDLDMGGHAIVNATISKNQVGLSNVENTAISTWTGSGNLTTLGTITAGIWHGSPVASSYIAWPPSLSPTAFTLSDSGSSISVDWNGRQLTQLHFGNDGAVHQIPAMTWGTDSVYLYAWDQQPLDQFNDDGTNNNGGTLYPSQIDSFINVQRGTTYGWVYPPWNAGRYTDVNGSILDSELYSVLNLWGDGDERYKSLNWSRRQLFASTSTMGDVNSDDPIQTESISLDWDSRFLYSGATATAMVAYPWSPDSLQAYTYWSYTAAACWQGGFHLASQSSSHQPTVGMRIGRLYVNGGNSEETFVLPKDSIQGATFIVADVGGVGFKVAQQSVADAFNPDCVIRQGTNTTTPGAAGYVECAAYSTITLMALDGNYLGDDYNADSSGGWACTRNWIVVSYSLGTPTFH